MSLMKHFLALEWTHQTSESHQFPSKSIQLMNTAIMGRFITLPHIGNLFHFFSRQSALISLHQLIFYLIFEEHSRFNSSIMSMDQHYKQNHSGFFWSKKVNATISKQAEQTQHITEYNNQQRIIDRCAATCVIMLGHGTEEICGD